MADVLPLRQPPQAPPHDLDAESAVLSAVLLAATAYDEIVDVLRAEYFYSDANRSVFEAVQMLRESGKPVDTVTVARSLHEQGRLAQVGGTPYLAMLIGDIPHYENIVEYAKIIRERWRLRQAIAQAQTLIGTVRAGTISDSEVQQLLEDTELAFGELAHQQQKKNFVPLGGALQEAYTQLQAMSQRGLTITGTPMNLRPLDQAMSGLHDGDLYIVAGRPGSGKTAFAMGVVENVAAQDLGVAVFSLEMPTYQLVTRMLGSHARIPVSKFRQPQSLKNDWTKIAAAMGTMEKYPVWIDDTGGISISEIRARVRRLKADIANGRVSPNTTCTRLKLVVVDYLQLVQGMRGRGQSREQEVSFVSRELKLLAKQEQVSVMALSQLNRAPELRRGTDKRPQLSDLRESGAIEQDADTVMFVYRPSMYAEDPALEGWAEIILGKQRNGPIGIHKLAFEKECVRFGVLDPNEFDEYDDFQDDL